MNDDEDENKKEYSYECLNLNDLNKVIYEGEEETKVKIILKNNKNLIWPKENTKLIFDYCSNFVQNDIILEPQKFNEIKEYDITFNELDSYPAGEYKIVLNFEINGENYGDKIEINLTIKEKDDDLIKVNEFRNIYGLNEDDYPDGKLLELLQKFNFDFEKAFDSLAN